MQRRKSHESRVHRRPSSPHLISRRSERPRIEACPRREGRRRFAGCARQGSHKAKWERVQPLSPSPGRHSRATVTARKVRTIVPVSPAESCKRFQDGRRAHLAGLAATMTRSINSIRRRGRLSHQRCKSRGGAGVPLEPDRNPHVWVAIAGPPGGPTFCNVHPEICRPARSMTVTRRVALVQQWSSWAVFPGHRRLA